MFVAQKLGEKFVRFAHRRLGARLAKMDPYRQRVDEQAHHPIRAFATLHASEQNRAEDHIFPARHLPQHPRPRQMTQAGYAYAETARMPAKATRKSRIKIKMRLLDPRTVSLHIQQSERSCRLIDILQHPPEEDFVFRPAQPQASLRHKVAERKRRG